MLSAKWYSVASNSFRFSNAGSSKKSADKVHRIMNNTKVIQCLQSLAFLDWGTRRNSIVPHLFRRFCKFQERQRSGAVFSIISSIDVASSMYWNNGAKSWSLTASWYKRTISLAAFHRGSYVVEQLGRAHSQILVLSGSVLVISSSNHDHPLVIFFMSCKDQSFFVPTWIWVPQLPCCITSKCWLIVCQSLSSSAIEACKSYIVREVNSMPSFSHYYLILSQI